MSKLIFSLLVVLLAFSIPFSVVAQEKVIHGIVTTFDTISVSNATVKVLSSNQTVLTDSNGGFSVSCNNIDKLLVTAKGFQNQKVKLTSKIKIVAVNLKFKSGKKNREYAIGYGHISDNQRLNAVANLNQDDLDFSIYSDMYDLIRGRLTGVQVINDQLVIRGRNSIASGAEVLIIVDGVIIESSILKRLSPAMVKNISVIKDGSAAIYGTRGTNGVVIIETRRGGDN